MNLGEDRKILIVLFGKVRWNIRASASKRDFVGAKKVMLKSQKMSASTYSIRCNNYLEAFFWFLTLSA